MTSKAVHNRTTAHGAITSQAARMAALYNTSPRGFLPRTLWDEATPPATPPATSPATPAQPQGGSETDRLERSLENLSRRHGGSDAAALVLLQEAKDYRARIRELENRVPEGAVVLTPAQAAQWQAYQALDADPAALGTRLSDGTAALEREQTRRLADTSGANADVLSDRLRASGMRAEVREVPGQNGTSPTRAVHVLNAEGQDQGELRAYATQHWAAYVPSLYPTPAREAGQGQAPGTPITPQAGGATGAPPADSPFAVIRAPESNRTVVTAFEPMPQRSP